MAHANRRSFVSDAVVATVILAGLAGLTYGVQFQPLRIPGYILLVGFGAVGGAIGPRVAFPVVFGVYLVSLGLVGAAAVRVVRGRIPETDLSRWRFGVAGALGVTGAVSTSFAIAAFVGTSQSDVVLLTGGSGLLLLGLAGWFAGLVTVSIGRE